MNIMVFEQDKAYIKRQLAAGEIDYVEVASEAAETELFKYVQAEGILAELAKTYPYQPKKQDVPLWLYIASDISMRLHGVHGFHQYPYVIRTGGLINALGPCVGRKTVHPANGQVTLCCPGFNKKNDYNRQTPCDQDYLRKMARRTDAAALAKWYSEQMPRLLAARKMFDTEGIFIGDASYIFVPNNKKYKGAVLMLFDEHNHPVKKENLTKEQVGRCRYRRCYKWVTLIHTNLAGDFYFFVGMRVVPGKDHECPIMYDMVDEFCATAGRGVMKWLIMDRGFLDGAQMGRLKTQWEVDTLSGLRSDMAVLADARGVMKLGTVPWKDYVPPQREAPAPHSPCPEPIVKRERARQRTLRRQEKIAPLPPPEKVAIVNDLTSWDSCPVPLTVVLTEREGEKPWGLVSTRRTQDAAFLRTMYHVRGAIEERYRQTKLFWDLAGFRSPNFNLVVNQVVFVALAYTLVQMHLKAESMTSFSRTTMPALRQQMLPYANHVIVYHGTYFAFLSIPEYTKLVLDIEGAARKKLKRTMQRLQYEFMHSLQQVRSP